MSHERTPREGQQQSIHSKLTLKEQELALGMLTYGESFQSHALSEGGYRTLVQEFYHNPFTMLVSSREYLRGITDERQVDRTIKYIDAYFNLIVKLDRDAFPPDERVRSGIPDYIPDGLVDMGSRPDKEPSKRYGREKVRVDKAEIFERAKPFLHTIFTQQASPDVSQELWEQQIANQVASFVPLKMPYNHTGDEHWGRRSEKSIGLHEFMDKPLSICIHQALMTQVLLQGFGITSRLMKSDMDGGEYVGAHVNNAVKIGEQWSILDSTYPEEQTDGTSRVFSKHIPELTLDLNVNNYRWDFQLPDGKIRRYTSRSNMYWYIEDNAKKKAAAISV